MEFNVNVPATDERNDRVVSFLKQRLVEKHKIERQMVADFQTDNAVQTAMTELDRQNEERGTPIIHL
ncbi:MAG: hypothetical protein EOO77_35600 [Oxalobacteraceae bacterium]|nr:MAG: hypothetical protein EOO77_35600 [Oxalobacteraceae bacterium]